MGNDRTLFQRAVARLNASVGNVTPKPKTYAAATSGGKADIFTKRDRNTKELDGLEVRYLQGGPVREAIDAYPLFMLSNGWFLDGKDEGLVKDVENKCDELDIEASLWEGTIDALVFGDGFQELVTGAGSRKDEVVAILPRPSKMFDIITDEHGFKTGYKQYRDMKQESSIPLDLQDILHISLFHVGGSKYGTSIVASAKDDIDRDVNMIASLVDSIDRHGHPRYHAKCGLPGEDPGTDVVNRVADQLDALKTKTELATCADVNIVSLDTAGIGNTKVYNDLTMGRLACGLGVPMDVLGITEGSNRATATVRQEVFEMKIGTIQRRQERNYNSQLIDRLLPDGGKGKVKFKFNDVNVDDELKLAQYVKTIAEVDGISPIVGHAWMRKKLGIKDEEADAE